MTPHPVLAQPVMRRDVAPVTRRTWGSTARAALVLLAFGDASGYELKRRADRTLRFFFNAPAMSQVYSELDRLALDGLVAVTGRPRGDRETKHYRITDAGTDELRRWLAADALAPTVFKSQLALRLVVGYLAEPDRLRADVDLERARVRADLHDLDAVRDLLDPADPRLIWARLVADWGDRYFRDVIGQLDQLRDDLDSPAPRTRAGTDPRLDGPHVSLVPVADADHDALRAIRSEPAVVARWLAPEPRWPDDDDDDHGYAIVLPAADGQPGADTVVGYIHWGEETDPQYRHAGIDLFVASARHGRGIGTAAVRLLAAHLLDERGFHRLVIDPAADNAAAIACYRKAGFREVGVMRQYERGPDGRWHDGLLMDLLAVELVRDRQENVITVTFAKAFRRHVECPDELVEPAPGSSGSPLRDVLGSYFERHPGVRTYVLDDAGALRRHVTVFVDDEQLTHREALDRSVTPASTVYLFQALSGG